MHPKVHRFSDYYYDYDNDNDNDNDNARVCHPAHREYDDARTDGRPF